MSSEELQEKASVDVKSIYDPASTGKGDVRHIAFGQTQVDTAAELVTGQELELDAKEADRIRRKIDWHLMPMMCTLYWIQYMDKTTLGNSAILGIKQSTHLTTSQYNWLGTIFFLSYLAFQYPQNLALQRFPVGKWMSINTMVWGITLCCHAACKNFGGLFAARFILGMCEGSITTGFMIVTSMFYTRSEQTVRVGYWFMMNGTAQIITGFIAFGSLHIHTAHFKPWQWLMIITGLLTIITAVVYWFFFPDSPTNAWFLTPEERAMAVRRLKANQTGVENKHFKIEQFWEAIYDPKTWLFALLAAINNIPTSIINQRQIIISSFGFNSIETTLLGCVEGVVAIVDITISVTLATRLKNARGYVGASCFLPCIVGALLVNLLPWDDKVGLLIGIWLTGTTGFVIILSWIGNLTAGHTKRVTTNAITLSAYCIGNAVGPFMWQAKYAPRNHVPWIVIIICYVVAAVLMIFIRFLLARENKRRDEEPYDDTYDNVYLEVIDEDGKAVQRRVSKEFLDLTDRQNRDFRYVL